MISESGKKVIEIKWRLRFDSTDSFNSLFIFNKAKTGKKWENCACRCKNLESLSCDSLPAANIGFFSIEFYDDQGGMSRKRAFA